MSIAKPNQIFSEWAKENKVSIVRVSEILNVSYPYASDILNGKRPVTFKTVGRLVKAKYTSVAERIAAAMPESETAA